MTTTQMVTITSQNDKDCSIRALSLATGVDYANVMAAAVEAEAYNPVDGTNVKFVQTYLRAHGWRQISPSRDKRSYRRVPAFKAEHMPAGPVYVSLKGHGVYVEDGVIHDTFDSIGYGRKRIYAFFVPMDSKETVGTFWDRLDSVRKDKYGKVWHTAQYDHYYVEYGRRDEDRPDNGVIPDGTLKPESVETTK